MGNLFSRKCDKDSLFQDHNVMENQENVDESDGANCTGGVEEEVRYLARNTWNYINKYFVKIEKFFYISYLTVLCTTFCHSVTNLALFNSFYLALDLKVDGSFVIKWGL